MKSNFKVGISKFNLKTSNFKVDFNFKLGLFQVIIISAMYIYKFDLIVSESAAFNCILSK